MLRLETETNRVSIINFGNNHEIKGINSIAKGADSRIQGFNRIKGIGYRIKGICHGIPAFQISIGTTQINTLMQPF